MKTFILVVIMKVYGGQSIQFQEFNSLSQCNYTRELIYVDTSRMDTWAETPVTAFCVVK